MLIFCTLNNEISKNQNTECYSNNHHSGRCHENQTFLAVVILPLIVILPAIENHVKQSDKNTRQTTDLNSDKDSGKISEN